MDVYHGMPYGNIIPVLVRSDADGAVTVVVNGETFSGTAATAVDDGLVLIKVIGQSGEAVVTTPSETETITLRKLPATGEVKLGVVSCGQITNKPAYGQFIERNVDCVVNIGDEFYPEFTHDRLGISTVDTTASLAAASDVQNYYDKNRQCRRTPELKNVFTTRGYARIPDDHDIGVNDCRWTLAAFQAAITGITDLTDMRAVIDASAKSCHDYDQINPPNNDANVDVNPFYTRFDLGEHAEVFMITSVCNGYDNTATDRLVRPETGDMISALQEAWLLARLQASSKKFKIILSPKMTLKAQYGNTDGWHSYAAWVTQRDRILQAIHDNSPGWSVPGGAIWISGDYHTPSVHAAENGVDGATYDHVNVTPAGSGSSTTNSGNPGTYTRKHHNDYSGSSGVSIHPNQHRLKNVGIITVPENGAYIEAEIVLMNGVTWWKGRVLAGENKLSYPQNAFGSA